MVATQIRFDDKYTPEPMSGCWLWTGAVNNHGYGKIYHDNKPQMAHRVALMLAGVVVADTDVVRHKCDNPSCVNPDHLTVGTQSDNMQDCVAKGRHYAPRGDAMKTSTLSPCDVREIKTKYPSEVRFKHGEARAVAKQYGINDATLWKIRNNKLWSHV